MLKNPPRLFPNRNAKIAIISGFKAPSSGWFYISADVASNAGAVASYYRAFIDGVEVFYTPASWSYDGNGGSAEVIVEAGQTITFGGSGSSFTLREASFSKMR